MRDSRCNNLLHNRRCYPPTAESTPYTGAFNIEATTTIQAIAIKGEDKSSIAKKTFEAIPTVATIAELNALTDKAPFVFTGEAVVVNNQTVTVSEKTRNYIFIKDATGHSLIFDANGTTTIEAGKHITPNWKGSVSIYNKLFEVVAETEITAVEGVSENITYDVAELADVTEENINKVVTLKGVTYTTPMQKETSLSQKVRLQLPDTTSSTWKWRHPWKERPMTW